MEDSELHEDFMALQAAKHVRSHITQLHRRFALIQLYALAPENELSLFDPPPVCVGRVRDSFKEGESGFFPVSEKLLGKLMHRFFMAVRTYRCTVVGEVPHLRGAMSGDDGVAAPGASAITGKPAVDLLGTHQQSVAAASGEWE